MEAEAYGRIMEKNKKIETYVQEGTVKEWKHRHMEEYWKGII